jgi:regulator of protease activity HflC (stomatin/prohibitin superfamily)
MERNLQRNGLVNLLALLAVGAAAFGVASYSRSLSGQIAAVFLGMGVLVAFVSWFQMRLEEREQLEKLELDEMARTKASSTLFDSAQTEVFIASNSRKQFEKYFVPGFTALLMLLQGALAFLLWRQLGKMVAPEPFRQEMFAMSLLGLLALVLFLLGRFSATIARLENHRLLRPSAGYLLLGAYLCALAALAVAGVKAEFPKTDLYVARGLVVILGLVAVETLATLVFEIYRPRVKGKVARALYDSRVIGVLAQPEGLFAAAAQTLDYQFGFKVSETWFFVALKEKARVMFLQLLAVLLLSSCFVFIEPGEHALLERWGRPVAGRAVLNPGAHLKMPWPMDQVYRYRTEQIQTLDVGSVPDADEHEQKIVLWTVAHSKEENFLIANREPANATAGAALGAKKTPPVSLITVSIPVQFQIRDLEQWAYNHADSSNVLQQIATREVVRYLVSADFNEIISKSRLESALALRDRIQAVADAQKLGAKILFVGLQDLHPPVKVAPEYEKVVGAIHQKRARIIAAEADAVLTNTLAAAQAFALTNSAEATRINLELTATARAAAFTNQLPAFNAAPSVYQQRVYAQVFPRAVANARKYVLLATNTSDVIQFDLQKRPEDDYINQLGSAITTPKKN